MAERKHLIFVYGTLRKGWGLNNSLVRGNADFIGNGITVNKYHMTASGCPFVHPEIPTSRIVGEVYGVGPALLEELDHIEGFRRGERENSNYYRSAIDIEMEDGRIIEADIYFNVRYADRTAIPSGDYADFEKIKMEGQRQYLLKQLRSLQTPNEPKEDDDDDDDNNVYLRGNSELKLLGDAAKFVHLNGIQIPVFAFEGFLYLIEDNEVRILGQVPETFTIEVK